MALRVNSLWPHRLTIWHQRAQSSLYPSVRPSASPPLHTSYQTTSEDVSCVKLHAKLQNLNFWQFFFFFFGGGGGSQNAGIIVVLVGSDSDNGLFTSLFGAKSLPESKLTYCKLNSQEQTSMKFKANYNFLKMRLSMLSAKRQPFGSSPNIWLNDAIWHHRTWSTLVQVMVCWHSSSGNGLLHGGTNVD